MTPPALVVLAAGAARRYGSLKQLEPLGPGGQALLDYSLFDAARGGFGRAVLVVRPELEARFRAHFDDVGAVLPVAFAHQTTEAGVGRDRSPSPGRHRLWGTGHAVLCAAPLLDGPFAVLNADDFYGRRALAAAAAHLVDGGSGRHGLVTYRVDRTLTSTGGVSRGWCRVGANGALEFVEELAGVARETGGAIIGRRGDGTPVRLADSDPVSMNLWAFRPSILDVLHRRFAEFVRTRGGSGESEFQLPGAVGGAIADGELGVEAIPTDAETFGVTFPADRTPVMERLAALTARGDYPDPLAPAGRGPDSEPAPGLPSMPGPAEAEPENPEP